MMVSSWLIVSHVEIPTQKPAQTWGFRSCLDAQPEYVRVTWKHSYWLEELSVWEQGTSAVLLKQRFPLMCPEDL